MAAFYSNYTGIEPCLVSYCVCNIECSGSRTGYRMSTPINIILDEAREPPLQHRFNYLTNNFMLKLFSLRDNDVLKSCDALQNAVTNSNIYNFIIKNSPLYEAYRKNILVARRMHTSILPPSFMQDYKTSCTKPEVFRFKLDLTSQAQQSANSSISSNMPKEVIKAHNINCFFLEQTAELRDNAQVFYTDGSKTDDDTHVGAAVYSPTLKLKLKHKLPGQTSIYSAEAWAMDLALTAAIHFPKPKVVIFSDSDSVIKASDSRGLFL